MNIIDVRCTWLHICYNYHYILSNDIIFYITDNDNVTYKLRDKDNIMHSIHWIIIYWHTINWRVT